LEQRQARSASVRQQNIHTQAVRHSFHQSAGHGRDHGLFRPFAQVRLARYLAGVFTVVPAAGFEAFAAAESVDVTAVGDETAELFDFDIAF
jgi:uncharacterized membrane protein YjgN (DUF898 family)